MSPDFLTLEEVLEIHSTQLARFGGAAGVRDVGLLESALSQPQASFGGQYVHEDLFEMASAYLFHVVSNHPFVDGNKRAGLLSALVFLDINGIEITDQGQVIQISVRLVRFLGVLLGHPRRVPNQSHSTPAAARRE
jgi:death-on-curing protein